MEGMNLNKLIAIDDIYIHSSGVRYFNYSLRNGKQNTWKQMHIRGFEFTQIQG